MNPLHLRLTLHRIAQRCEAEGRFDRAALFYAEAAVLHPIPPNVQLVLQDKARQAAQQARA